MLNFLPLSGNELLLKDYIEKTDIRFCDISIGVKFLWRENFRSEYAISGDSLILKESCPYYKDYFYFPFGGDTDKALLEIENYCREKNIPLCFCCIDNATVNLLHKRYCHIEVNNDRDWSDYIYSSQDFIGFKGKKFGGQRNHINKFKLLFPDYKFKEIKDGDEEKIKLFIKEFTANCSPRSWSEKEEWDALDGYIDKAKGLNQVGGYIEVGGKIVAISYGETVGDTLIVHIEKGLREYEGVYPTMANEFAKAFVGDRIKYINREEDCGDMGLRISKLQYHPVEVKEKNTVRVITGINMIKAPEIKTERLVIKDIEPFDNDYKEICTDEKLNEYFGYDYKTDLKGEPDAEYFYNFQKGLKESGEEYDFAVKLTDKTVGEVCLYNFDYYGGAEIGFRIARDYQRKGFGKEAVKGLILYAERTLGLKKLYAKCYKQNTPSFNLLTGVGFIKTGEDTTYHYFEKLTEEKL